MGLGITQLEGLEKFPYLEQKSLAENINLFYNLGCEFLLHPGSCPTCYSQYLNFVYKIGLMDFVKQGALGENMEFKKHWTEFV